MNCKHCSWKSHILRSSFEQQSMLNNLLSNSANVDEISSQFKISTTFAIHNSIKGGKKRALSESFWTKDEAHSSKFWRQRGGAKVHRMHLNALAIEKASNDWLVELEQNWMANEGWKDSRNVKQECDNLFHYSWKTFQQHSILICSVFSLELLLLLTCLAPSTLNTRVKWKGEKKIQEIFSQLNSSNKDEPCSLSTMLSWANPCSVHTKLLPNKSLKF